MPLRIAETVAALDRMLEMLPGAALAAARAMGDLGTAAIKRNLNRTSHAYGTPTPSSPGQPPSRVGGGLAGSVQKTREVPGPYSLVVIAPTAIYARVQELGGGISHLPPRPYVRPAVDDLKAIYRAPAIAAIRAALFGG